MKQGVWFALFQSMFIATPALAFDAGSCAANSTRLKLSERSAYLKSCLAQASSPANVREAELQEKKAFCEQNAKNYSLQGNNRASYIASCINKNEAEVEAKAVAAKVNKSARATARAEQNQERPTKNAAKPAPAKAGVEDKPKAKPKPKTYAARDGKRETRK